jgi:hypothetical protein
MFGMLKTREARLVRTFLLLTALVLLTATLWNLGHPISGCAINPATGEVWGTTPGSACAR